MNAWAAIGVELGLAVLAAGVTTGGRLRRAVGFALGLLTLVPPFCIEPSARVMTFFAALTALLISIRSGDLLVDPAARPFGLRLWHLVAIFDTRLAKPIPRRWESALFFQGLAWLMLNAVVDVAGLWGSSHSTGWVHYLIRWGGAAGFAVSLFEAFPRLLVTGYHLIGIDPPPLHDRPYLSRSVGEFWGVRWNKVVGRCLRLTFYDPLVRRGSPRAAMAATFAASAIAHAYLTLPVLGRWWSLMMAGFFMAQGLLLVTERRLHVRRWRPPLARIWTIGALLAVSPLFSEPLVQFVDPSPPPTRRATE